MDELSDKQISFFINRMAAYTNFVEWIDYTKNLYKRIILQNSKYSVLYKLLERVEIK